MNDTLRKELRTLRTRQGATANRIAERPTLVSVLGPGDTSPDDLAVMFFATLGKVADQKAQAALFNAYGRGSSKSSSLDGRRQDYASLIGKHPDTVENWENAGIDELVKLLLAAKEPSTNLPHVVVTGMVSRRHLTYVSVMPLDFGFNNPNAVNELQETNEVAMVVHRAIESSSRWTLPAVIYQLPTDHYHVELLIVSAAWLDTDQPAHHWGVWGKDPLELVTGVNVVEAELLNNGPWAVTFEAGQLKPGYFYALCWRYSGTNPNE